MAYTGPPCRVRLGPSAHPQHSESFHRFSCARATSTSSWCRAGKARPPSTGSRGGSAISRPHAAWSRRTGSHPTRIGGSAPIIAAVATSARPAVLVAHSLGVIATVHAGLKLPHGAIAGAFLVAPADVDNAGAWPATQGYAVAPIGLRLCPGAACAPAVSLDVACLLRRPLLPAERARHFAAAWGSELVEVGPAGHITAETGHGPWPDGVLRFGRFLAGLRP